MGRRKWTKQCIICGHLMPDECDELCWDCYLSDNDMKVVEFSDRHGEWISKEQVIKYIRRLWDII